MTTRQSRMTSSLSLHGAIFGRWHLHPIAPAREDARIYSFRLEATFCIVFEFWMTRIGFTRLQDLMFGSEK